MSDSEHTTWFSRSVIRKTRDLGYIFLRHIFLPMNFIISTVFGLLMYFGDTQEGLFLAILLLFNVSFGIAQEINAWIILERLQSLMAVRVIRVGSAGAESEVLADEIRPGDQLRLRLGDQMPADGVVVSTQSMDVNKALITGESSSTPRIAGAALLAGSIVTSGGGIVKIEGTFDDSTMGRMTQSIRKYSRNSSPIQGAVNLFSWWMGGILVVITIIAIARGMIMHEAAYSVVRTIGAIAAISFPQGLVLAITLLFSYGAHRLLKKSVILQEINAIEKLGRIKNLCMDKTGTLTDTTLTVESIQTPNETPEAIAAAKSLCAAYFHGSGDSSQTIEAITAFLNQEFNGTIIESLAFSSDRQYGAVHAQTNGNDFIIIAGGPDTLLPYLKGQSEKSWLEDLIDKNTLAGKRVFCVLQTIGTAIPRSLTDATYSITAAFVLQNQLRPGIGETVKFFQDRGVALRIISGDNPETVRTIATSAGFPSTDTVISGSEMEDWSDSDYTAKAGGYIIFARIKPEQKERIITALKLQGFTAMIGDGANDALAIKRADLGIAMYNGAPATRAIASVVLQNNSFADFPNAVRLADRIIESAEIFTSIFFNQTFVGILFFCFLTIGGFDFPFTPLNTSFISYFIVVFPGALVFSWVITSRQQTLEPSPQSFIRRVIPFPLVSSVIQSAFIVEIWLFARRYVPSSDPSTLALIATIALGYVYFLFTPSTYGGSLTRTQVIQLALLALTEIGVLLILFHIPVAINFYDIKYVGFVSIMKITPFVMLYAGVQYVLTKLFFRHKV